jgi:hypothetical protein
VLAIDGVDASKGIGLVGAAGAAIMMLPHLQLQVAQVSLLDIAFVKLEVSVHTVNV